MGVTREDKHTPQPRESSLLSVPFILWEEEKALTPCQPSPAAAKTSGCYQHWFGLESKTQLPPGASEGTPLPSAGGEPAEEQQEPRAGEFALALARLLSLGPPPSPRRAELWQSRFTPAMTLPPDPALLPSAASVQPRHRRCSGCIGHSAAPGLSRLGGGMKLLASSSPCSESQGEAFGWYSLQLIPGMLPEKWLRDLRVSAGTCNVSSFHPSEAVLAQSAQRYAKLRNLQC